MHKVEFSIMRIVQLFSQRMRFTAQASAFLTGLAFAGILLQVQCASAQNMALRLETDDAHSAVTAGLAVSHDGKLIVTSSNDQSIRIWSVPDLNLVRRIYLPIGASNQGAAYTVAFSPDAKSVATTGWTGFWDARENSWCFYVIDVETGSIRETVCDLPTRANHVAYSPDGRFLAFALKNGKGLRVYRTSDYTLVAEDGTCGASSTWVEFDKAGRIITTCYDGNVLLYDRDFQLIARHAMPEGRRPDSLGFSPDGSRIVVGYDEPGSTDPQWKPAVDVISGVDLKVLFRLDTTGIDNGALWRVAWSGDGRFVYAGGTWRSVGQYPVRQWSDAGKGGYQDLPGAESHVLRLRSLPDASFAVTGERPYLAVVANDGEQLGERQLPTADFVSIGDTLGVSRDGYTVQFAYARSGRKPARFSFHTRRIEKGEATSEIEMAYPVTSVPGIDVGSWQRGYSPTLNGRPLKMVRTYEHALSLTIPPNIDGFVLGTVWHVIRYDKRGSIVWATQVPFNAHGVVSDSEGRLVVAALGDGTIRWYAMETGKELLALFPHRDGRRWVAWTPKGYFMASVGGEELIGWQVNQGRRKEGEFFALNLFRDQYYRPDIVRLVLQTLDEDRAIAIANEKSKQRAPSETIEELLPPVIKILSPDNGAGFSKTTVKISYVAYAPKGSTIEGLDVRVNGKQILTRGLSRISDDGGVTRYLEIPLPKRDATVSLQTWAVRNGQKRVSAPATVEMSWAGPEQKPSSGPRLFALLVGVSQYASPGLNLKWASQDARDMSELLKAQQGQYYSTVETRLITDEDATTAALLEGLEWLESATSKPDDYAIIFLAGHGVTDDKQRFFFLPTGVDPTRLLSTAVSRDQLVGFVKSLSGRVVMFIDACHSAAGLEAAGWGRSPADLNGIVNDLALAQNGAVMFASSTGGEVSIERDEWQNGAFTEALKAGLSGDADYTGDDKITTEELSLFLTQKVSALSAGTQQPVMHKSKAIPAFTIAARR